MMAIPIYKALKHTFFSSSGNSIRLLQRRILLARYISSSNDNGSHQETTKNNDVEAELVEIRLQYQKGVDAMLVAIQKAVVLQDRKFSEKIQDISMVLENATSSTSNLQQSLLKQQEDLKKFQYDTELAIQQTGKRVGEECKQLENNAARKFQSFEAKLNEHIWHYNIILMIVTALILGYSNRLKLFGQVESFMDKVTPIGWWGRDIIHHWKEELLILNTMSQRIEVLEERSTISSLLSLEIARLQSLCDASLSTSYWLSSISNGYIYRRKMEALIEFQYEIITRNYDTSVRDNLRTLKALELAYQSRDKNDDEFLKNVMMHRLKLFIHETTG